MLSLIRPNRPADEDDENAAAHSPPLKKAKHDFDLNLLPPPEDEEDGETDVVGEKEEEERSKFDYQFFRQLFVGVADFGIDLTELPEMRDVPMELYDWTPIVEEIFGSEVNQDSVRLESEKEVLIC